MTTYFYNDSPYTDGDNYCRSYYTDATDVSTLYSPGAFFNYFASKSAVTTKLNYAKSGLGFSGGSAIYTDTYNPSTGQSTGGSEFRAIFTYSVYIGREPYNEYSHVATPLSLYDVCIRSTDSETYINSATYSGGSWSTTTDSTHGRVIIGTTGKPNSITVSDDIISVDNNVVPLLDSAYNIGSTSNKFKDLYVSTIHADNYDGIDLSGSSSSLIYNDTTKLEAVSDGVKSYSTLYASTQSYNLGSQSYKWGTIYANSIGTSSSLTSSIYTDVIHAYGNNSNNGIVLCDAPSYESSGYCSITGYETSNNGKMTFHFVNASYNLEYTVEMTGPNTSVSGSETLTTIPKSSGTWSLGNSSRKLGNIYCTTVHADTCDGNCFSNTQSANTQSRTISASGYSLTEGVLMSVYFKYSHSGATTPTLNINSTGAFNLVDVSGESIKTWEDDTQMFLYYDSTFKNTSNNKKYVVIWRSDTGVIASSGTGQDVGNVTFGTSSVSMTKLGTDGTTSSSSITPYSSVSVSGTNITDSLMKTIAWRFGGGVASYGQSDSTGSNVGAIGLFALRRSSPTTTGSISSIHANNICAGSCLYQLEIHSTGLTSSTATSTSISLHVFNYWRSGTWLILTPYLNNFQGMSIVLATQILA